MTDTNGSMETAILKVIKDFYKGVPHKPVDYLKEKKAPYYVQVDGWLRKNNLIKYNKNTAEPYTIWNSNTAPDISMVRTMLNDIKSRVKSKNTRRENKLMHGIKTLCKRLEETSPGFSVDLEGLENMPVKLLKEMYKDLDRTVMRSEVEGPVYDRKVQGANGLRLLVENASDPTVNIPWDGVDREKKRFKAPNVDITKKSLTVEFMSIIREIQILASVEPSVEAASIHHTIHTKMQENPAMRQYYMAYLREEL